MLFVLNYRKFGRFDFRLGSLGILMGWVILFSLSTEKHTYVIALAGYLMWYWVQARKGWLDRTLFWATSCCWCSVPVDLICPSPVMRFLCDTVQLNIYCFTFTWLRMIYVTFLRPTEGPDFLANRPTGRPTERFAAEISPLQEFIVNCVGSPA